MYLFKQPFTVGFVNDMMCLVMQNWRVLQLHGGCLTLKLCHFLTLKQTLLYFCFATPHFLRKYANYNVYLFKQPFTVGFVDSKTSLVMQNWSVFQSA